MALIGSVSGSHTKLADGTTYIEAGSNITIVSGSGDHIQISATDTNTTYTAGDGLDLSGTEFSTDLKSGGGLKIDTTELAVEPNDFAGTGLEDDGSDNLRISAAAAGNGLTGGAGSALAVGAGIGISVASTTVGVDNTVVATLSGSQFSGNVGVTGSISASGQLSGSVVFVDTLSGSLTTLTDGRPLILGAGATSVSSGSPDKPGQITISSADTTYTAGDGLDLSGTEFTTDLKTGGGIHIVSTELAIDNSVVATISGSQFSGAVGVTGSLEATGRVVSENGTSMFNRVDVGGGYGSTGASIYANGGLSMDGDLVATNVTVGDGNFYAATGQSLVLNSPHHIIMKLDTDNNSTATFQIDNGAGTEILNVDESGNLQIDGGIQINSNAITASDGGTPIIWDTSDNVLVSGSLQVISNTILNSEGETTITMTAGQSVSIASELQVLGGEIFGVTDGTLSLKADTDMKFYIDNDGGESGKEFQWYDDATERMVLDQSGNLQIDGDITIGGNTIKASDGGSTITLDTSDNVTIGGDLTITGNDIKDSAGNIMFSFDASGNIDSIGEIETDVVIKSASTSDVPKLHIESLDGTANDAGEINFERYDDTVLSAGESIGEIRFSASETNDGTYYVGAAIHGDVGTGTWTDSSSQPGKLSFYTVADGGTSLIERMNIDSDGTVTLSGDLAVNGDDITSDGDLTITPGADLKITPTGGQVLIDGDLYLYGDDGYTNLTCQIYDSTNAGVILLKDSNSTKVQLNSVANGDSYFNSGGALCVGATAASAPIQFYVLESSTASTSYIAHIRNSGNGSNADCLRLDIGYTSNPTTTNNFVRMYHSTSTAAGKITGDGSGGVSYVDAFTGTHPSVTSDSTASLIIGMIVSSTGEIWAKNMETVSTGIPKTTLSNTDNDKTVFGILAEIGKDANGEYCYEGYVESWGLDTGEEALVVNSIGEGLVWITNINGNIENGDYITTSTIAGYGRLQGDDLLHSYTVAKCTETVDWNSVTDTIEHEGQTYKKHLVSCTYHCG